MAHSKSPNPEEDQTPSAERAYRNLAADLQRLLVCLAPFTAAAHPAVLTAYLFMLLRQPALAWLPLARWKEAITAARNQGLLRPHPAEPNCWSVPPEWTSMLRARPEYSLCAPTRLAIDTAFRQVYREFVESVHKLFESSRPDDKQLGRDVVYVEYDNIVAAMDIALSHRVSVLPYYATVNDYLRAAGHHQRALQVGEDVLARLDQCASATKTRGGIDAQRAAVIDCIADHQRWLGQYEAAEASYRRALAAFINAGAAVAAEAAIATTHHKLGLLAYDQRDWGQAEEHFQESLAFKIKTDDRAHLPAAYHLLARAATRQEDLEQARQYYHRAIELYGSRGDRLSQSHALVDLASLACKQGRRKEAKRYYRHAMVFFREFNDRVGEGLVHHHLGIMAQERKQPERAWAHYRKARRLFYEAGDRQCEATTCNNLAALAWRRGLAEVAAKYYQHALRLSRAANDHHAGAVALRGLGRLARRSRDWKRAERCYRKAMTLNTGLNDSGLQAALNVDCGFVAYKQRRWDEAQRSLLAGLAGLLEHEDDTNLDRCLWGLAWLWSKTEDRALLVAVGETSGKTPEQVESFFRKALHRE
jgi:tetratricopeptide (TPR) repeat protein